MKIKFCSHGLLTLLHIDEKININPAYFFLKKWYELHGKNPDLIWLDPGMIVFDSIDIVIKNIVQERPDVLGLGLYVWNYELQYQIAKEVKQQLPDTIIVLGGTQLDVHKDFENGNQSTNYFKEHSYIDYVVYGDGEKPFQQIIDYHGGFIANKNNFVNIIENNQGQGKCYPYELLDDSLYLSQSPFLSQEDDMIRLRNYLNSRSIPNKNQYWAIEFARGCMYSCTFCDWSQNLTKKVKRRTHDWKQDLDLFCRLDVPIRETDANFGQWPDDIKAFDYAISLYDPTRNFSFTAMNTPKLKKDITEYLLLKNSLVYNMPPKISIQDPMKDVLMAINRPSVPWTEISKMVKNLKDKLPIDMFRLTTMETILGLPEQTIDSVAESYMNFFKLGIMSATYHLWHILPNSPAADPKYQKFWGIKTKTIYEPFRFHLRESKFGAEFDETWSPTTTKFESLADLYYQLSQTNSDNSKRGSQGGFFKSNGMVVEHKKMTTVDMWAALRLKSHWHKLHRAFNLENRPLKNVKTMLIKLKNNSLKESNYQYQLHKEFIDKYNFIVWGRYDPTENKLFKF